MPACTARACGHTSVQYRVHPRAGPACSPARGERRMSLSTTYESTGCNHPSMHCDDTCVRVRTLYVSVVIRPIPTYESTGCNHQSMHCDDTCVRVRTLYVTVVIRPSVSPHSRTGCTPTPVLHAALRAASTGVTRPSSTGCKSTPVLHVAHVTRQPTYSDVRVPSGPVESSATRASQLHPVRTKLRCEITLFVVECLLPSRSQLRLG